MFYDMILLNYNKRLMQDDFFNSNNLFFKLKSLFFQLFCNLVRKRFETSLINKFGVFWILSKNNSHHNFTINENQNL